MVESSNPAGHQNKAVNAVYFKGPALAWLNAVESNYRPGESTDQQSWSRGFTLVELMVVVVIITVLSALAIPSILRQMRDRRTRQAAEEIASVYRQARLRALGRGAAVMVRFTAANGFEMREAVLGGNDPACARLPVTSCTTANWGTTSTTSQRITQFNPTSGVYAGITTSVFASTNGGTGTVGSSLTGLDICFTPMGRSLFGIDGGALSPMTGVPLITVQRDAASLTRLVVIPPNGLARTDVSQ